MKNKTLGLETNFQNVTDKRSNTMKKIRSKGSKIEDLVSKYLWHKGFRFRRNSSSLLGKPDLSARKYKIVIFIDSCFWHGCSDHFKIPKNNHEYWKNKINYNKKRDKEVNEYYSNKKWNLFRIWEHDFKKNSFVETLESLEKSLNAIIKK